MTKTALLALAFLLLLSLVPNSQLAASDNSRNPHLSPRESEIIARINGTNTYNYDLELEKLALNTSIPNYAFRSAGSAGASEAAQWIKRQFESFGLESSMEQFEFTTWNLLSKPAFVIDDDGDSNTLSDQEIVESFQPAHYSWPTAQGGLLRDLVVLPLPEARNRDEIMEKHININPWRGISITGKIVLIGREHRWNRSLRLYFINKVKSEPPAAIIYTWWYDWMSFAPPMFGSIGGLADGTSGPHYWDLKIPSGWISYEDGLWIRKRENTVKVSASLNIPAVIGSGPHYNVVGKLKGSVNAEKFVIISGHYDTVMTSGFCDNGAGTAGVIELARVFAQASKEGLYNPEQTLLFIAFTGEELGFVGSINYMKQHEADMKNISAVINLDCIGSDVLRISETFPNDSGLDLDEIVLRGAEDLGIKAEIEESGGSDQEAFRNPAMTNTLYYRYWRIDAGIRNLTRVKASAMLSSYPLFYSDIWENGTPGWIHTPYDNSTSTSTLNWVEVDDLEAHVQAAALSVMRVFSIIYSPFLSQVFTFTMVTGILVATAVYFKRSRVSLALKKTRESILDYIQMKEGIYIVTLTVMFLFMSYILYMRMENTEVIVDGLPTPILIAYFGYPFRMIGIEQIRALPPQAQLDLTLSSQAAPRYNVHTLILWDGLFLNIAFYFLLAFAVAYFAARLRDMLL